MKGFSRQIRYDIRTGTVLAWKEFALVFLIVLMILFSMHGYIDRIAVLQNKEISWLDYLCGFFKGMREFSTMDRTQNFDIPVEWFLIHAGYYLLMAKYPCTDFEERGHQFFIRSGSKLNWWISKCIWVFINTLVYYGIIYFTSMTAAVFLGNLKLCHIKDIWGLQMNQLQPGQLMIALFIIPVWMAAAFGLFEMFLSFVWSPLVAVIIMMTICVASAYWYNPFLPGNYTMLIRNHWLFADYDIPMGFGFIYAILIGAVSVVFGYRIFYRQDAVKDKSYTHIFVPAVKSLQVKEKHDCYNEEGVNENMYLEVKNITKIIDKNTLLDSVSLHMDKGKIYGLKGKNGSGKTMIMRAICGLINLTEGEVYIDGKPLDKNQNFPPSVGVLIENPGFINNYSGARNLKVLADIKGLIGMEEIGQIMTLVGLDPHEKKKVKKYSLGMKQKLGIAAAIMENPDMILLDEPTNALDQDSIHALRDILKGYKEQGKLIIISSHDAEELEYLSDEIYMIEDGKIKGTYTPK